MVSARVHVENAEQPEKNTLTRADVAARLGVSTSTVRRYEGDLLHPKKGADGVNRFEPAEVAALAMRLNNVTVAIVVPPGSNALESVTRVAGKIQHAYASVRVG